MDPLWYKDAVIYQLHVRSFYDANDDGYGDFEGLRQKLPYLEALGVNTLWLMPFFQSPLRDDGYDISDYYQILPVHGSLEDFKRFLDEAHEMGLRVIVELVLNHTSIDHPWFQEARKPGSPMRDWYVWSDTPEKYKGVRVIFQDFETSNWTFDPVAGAYYWHRFYHHQPDLNWDNPEVEKAMQEVMFFWADLGVDGFRLDAIPYLYEREGTSCENLPETIAAVKRLRAALEKRYGPGKILLAEANMWPEETLPYFGEGDGVHMAYNFPLMPRIFMALRREDRRPIEAMLQETEGIPESAQWALFLRNHDELTLEKVTEEEREFLWEIYAPDPRFRINLGIRRRLMPLLGGDRRRYELLQALLLTLKGSPILYYGDEIGMGDNPFLGDRNGVRTPMQWYADRNAGFSRAPYHRLFLPPVSEGPYSYHFVNVEAQQDNPHSLLNFNRRLLALRKRYAQVFGQGTLTLLPVENRRILAYLRTYGEERLLVVANLSRYTQAFHLPLEAFQGLVPIELFSQNPFPPVTQPLYPMTLGPHGFTLFALALPETIRVSAPDWAEEVTPEMLPQVPMEEGLESLFVETMADERARAAFLKALVQWLGERSWLALKPQRGELYDALRFQKTSPLYLTLLQLEHHGRTLVFLPLAWDAEERESSGAFARTRPREGYLYELSQDAGFYALLLRRLKEGFQGRSLKAYYRGEHRGPVPEELTLLRPGLAAGDGVWLQLGLVQDGGLNRTLETLPRLDLPWILPPEGQLVWERGRERRVLALTGPLPEGKPQEAFALVQTLAAEGLARLRGQRLEEGGAGLLVEALRELESLARLLGVRLALLHQRLKQVEGEGEGVPLLGRGLGAFLEVSGELYLLALGPRGWGSPLEDLARMAYDLERAVELAWESLGEEEEGMSQAVGAFVVEALLGAYQDTVPEPLDLEAWPGVMASWAEVQLQREERSIRLRILRRWKERAASP
ncbi:maltose alpha-D-glucosyltransferase [Meiothermus ruber]|uniref:maltose alpha-D-glucosyltransferase n=1 Tax=Meiothermus ruber (strain ATCC 35948 / DSM 1279 / VKM B-1258 / 21) TaxID=504728 RepID=D3PNR9_MEIRD|nr:maltose alpha-D-glucosyltransferase [Meiothermus ruber]GIW32295.1 MAG: trehalose synthase [Meiothermus sp.]ADD29464.1 trehalose synthase [Meiothermus ruber DSM 1279]AGK05086.1 trehalose synthase [Meiothermus ruber DSM 1279]MCL6529326.1 maltose alpha-D-glucosyltransferase [Meiothermus ruber]GAO76386.1 trehalose synthase [Meiothermus ruber H328]